MIFSGDIISAIREESNSLICRHLRSGNSNFIDTIKLPAVDVLVCNLEYGTGVNEITHNFIQIIEKKIELIDKEINNLCKVKFEDGRPVTEQMIYLSMNANFKDIENFFQIADLVCEKIRETEYLFINDVLLDIQNKKVIDFR